MSTALLLILCGCSVYTTNFDRLYEALPEDAQDQYVRPPVVIVPGLLGSKLVHDGNGDVAWPGGITQLAFGRYKSLVLPLSTYAGDADPGLRQTLASDGVTESAFGRDFYGKLLQILVSYGGYERANIGTPVSGPSKPRAYVFDYDWRLDNVDTAKKLHAFLQAIRDDYDDQSLKVDMIAHSMGGLMARYYMRFGDNDVLNDNRLRVTWAGATHINKMILLGVPNLGSVSAIEGFILGQSVGLRRIPQEVVATMPSTYQLFPHRIVSWLYDVHGEPIDRDQFDVNTWSALGWNIFNPRVRERVTKNHGAAYYDALVAEFAMHSERARRFSWSLTVCPNYDEAIGGCPEFAEPPIRMVVFGGNCNLTPARWVFEESSGGDNVRFAPNQVRNKIPGIDYDQLMYDPGDGTVTKPSLLARDALSPNTPRHSYSYFPLAYSFLLCEDHATLTSNTHFQDNLLDVLLTRALPWELHKDHATSR